MSRAGGTAARRRAESRGRLAETLAAALLIAKGYRIIATRWRGPAGEIDLVALRRRQLVFVEVRQRTDLADAAFSIGPEKRRRLERAAASFVAAQPAFADCDMRFDAVLMAPWSLPRHLPDAFAASGQFSL